MRVGKCCIMRTKSLWLDVVDRWSGGSGGGGGIVVALLAFAVKGGIPHELKYEFDALRYGDSVKL